MGDLVIQLVSRVKGRINRRQWACKLPWLAGLGFSIHSKKTSLRKPLPGWDGQLLGKGTGLKQLHGVQNSGPWNLWPASDFKKNPGVPAGAVGCRVHNPGTWLAVVKNSRLFTQRTVRPICLNNSVSLQLVA